jgi:hypothetical protein
MPAVLLGYFSAHLFELVAHDAAGAFHTHGQLPNDKTENQGWDAAGAFHTHAHHLSHPNTIPNNTKTGRVMYI